MTKILLYNEKTGELLATQADINGPVFAKYIKMGLLPIGYLFGVYSNVGDLDKDTKEELDIIVNRVKGQST